MKDRYDQTVSLLPVNWVTSRQKIGISHWHMAIQLPMTVPNDGNDVPSITQLLILMIFQLANAARVYGIFFMLCLQSNLIDKSKKLGKVTTLLKC